MTTDDERYRDGLRDGRMQAIEEILGRHEERMDRHERRMDSHSSRLRLLERIIWIMLGGAAALQFLPRLAGVLERMQ